MEVVFDRVLDRGGLSGVSVGGFGLEETDFLGGGDVFQVGVIDPESGQRRECAVACSIHTEIFPTDALGHLQPVAVGGRAYAHPGLRGSIGFGIGVERGEVRLRGLIGHPIGEVSGGIAGGGGLDFDFGHLDARFKAIGGVCGI